VSTPDRASSVRRWLVAVLAPALLFVLAVGPRFGGLLAAMWVVLVGTMAFAALSRGGDRPDEYDPRGRLYGRR
jgi:hypothetical protein